MRIGCENQYTVVIGHALVTISARNDEFESHMNVKVRGKERLLHQRSLST